MSKKPHKHKSKGKSCYIPDNGFRNLLGLDGQDKNMEISDHLRDKNNQKKQQNKKNNNNQLRTTQVKK